MVWTRRHTIGYGSTATVSLATSNQSGDVFAVKSTELSQSEPLQREQQFLSNLSSPHIVSYKGCDITRENNKLMYNLFMEYVPGGSLADMTHRQKGHQLDESLIRFYTNQLLQGLQYLHKQGLVHCDIKARNILISQDGAKIADFGCVKWVDEAARIGGTPMFMAPEVARGEEQGFPCDIWAVGCTVIEMATGDSPWPNEADPFSVIYRIAHSGDSPRIPNFLSHEAKDFLTKCLQRDPKQRWTVNQLLKHQFLKECYSNSPTSVLDQGIWSSIEEPSSSQSVGENMDRTSLECFERIGRLAVFSGEARWREEEEEWITVRESEVGGGEGEVECGSGMDRSGYGLGEEEEEREEERLEIVGEKGSCSISGNCLGDRGFREDDDRLVISSLNFQVDRLEFLVPLIPRFL